MHYRDKERSLFFINLLNKLIYVFKSQALSKHWIQQKEWMFLLEYAIPVKCAVNHMKNTGKKILVEKSFEEPER